MKKIILVITAFIFSAGVYAQSDSTNGKMNQPAINKANDGMNPNPDYNKNQNQDGNNPNNQNGNLNQDPKMNPDNLQNHPDGYTMQNGKMMVVSDGKMTAMEKDVTLPNGTMIMSNGYFMKKGGTKMMLKEGQSLDVMGNTNPVSSATPKTN